MFAIVLELCIFLVCELIPISAGSAQKLLPQICQVLSWLQEVKA